MHLVSPALWSLVGSSAYLGVIVDAAGVLEIDVVFPRNNETYAPTDKFPVVYALQNAQLAKGLKPVFDSFVRNGSNLTSDFGYGKHDLTWANYSSEPYLVYHRHKIDTEGPYELFTIASWEGCDESGRRVAIGGNSTNFSVRFTIKRGGQEVDLVAATANQDNCSAQGVAIDVTDQTLQVSATVGQPATTCTVLASTSPTPPANPCRVKIDSAAVASMSAVLHGYLCRGLNPPADCPKDNAAQHLAVAGVASFVAVLGAVGFLLA